MSAPFRDGSPHSDLPCPRCRRPLPPLELATCTSDCGTWVASDAANHLFTPDELAVNALSRWWRVRSPCPKCAVKMTTRNRDPDAMFQGCDAHGVFVDADVLHKTSLGRTDVREILAARHDAAAQQRNAERARQAALEREEQLRQQELEKERREEENRRRGERAQLAAQARAREEDLRLKRELEQREEEARRARQEADRRAREEERARQEAAAHAKAEQERAQREAAREQRRLARERFEAELGAKRPDVLARVNAAIAAGDGSAIVDEILGLERTVGDLARRLELMERALGVTQLGD